MRQFIVKHRSNIIKYLAPRKSTQVTGLFVAITTLTLIVAANIVPAAVSALPVPVAPDKTAVLDQAEVIPAAEEATLSQKLIDYKQKTGNEIAVLTVKSLEGEDAFDYSFKVAQAWGVGSESANNGALFFVAVEDRKNYIQVGRGLEPYLTDLQSNLILQQKVNPEFRTGNFVGGINAGVDNMISVIGGDRLSPNQADLEVSDWLGWLLVGGSFMFMYIASFLARSKSWWAGGVLGALPGLVMFFTVSFLPAILVFGLGVAAGLLLDFFLSKNYRERIAAGDSTGWWRSGGGFWGGSGGIGGGGGFGGFGGGSFGGGGSGSSW